MISNIGTERVTRKRTLLECLRIIDAQKKNMSRDLNGLEPMPGCEAAWEMERRKEEILRELIRALESPEVERAVATWQKEITAEDAEGKPHPYRL